MLVCSISMRPRGRAIAADLAEAAAANDGATTGSVVFATLVDDPANVADTVDAYLGEIMLEAASATDTVDAGGATVAADVAEAASAGDTPDATVISGVTWDGATVTAVTLSGGNLVATNTGTTAALQGAHVASGSGKTSGKYYYEVTFTTLAGGGNYGTGVGTPTSSYSTMGNNATSGVMVYRSGNIWSDPSNTGSTLGSRSAGDTIGVAVDLDNRKLWFRVAPSGNWNGSGTANPATNTGGVTIPSGTMVPFCTFGGTGGVAGNVQTANFGASAFSGTVPSGFTSGWTP